jgi:hypothetical protein
MAEALDIWEVAKAIFARAKEILQQEGSLHPVRLVLNTAGELRSEHISSDGKTAACGLSRELFPSEDSGVYFGVPPAAPREAGQKTKRAAAVAFFTIRQATYQVFEPYRLPPSAPGKMPDGWIKDSQPHDCLDMRIEVPGQDPACIAVPFRRYPDGSIEFGEQWDGPEDFEGPAPPSSEAEGGLKN